jgi:hypothetical protein
MFGHRYRLELLAALARVGNDEAICLTPLAQGCNVLSSVYYPALKLLVAAGLVRRMARTRDDPRVLYARTQGPVWTGLRRIVEDLEVEIDLRSVVHPRRDVAA